MALIKCPKCNHEISDTSKKCIHCGTSLREKKIIPKKKKNNLTCFSIISDN